ncbi:MAG: HAD hydrolase-like protein, partial [Candidatus Thorarchaeota archaeon]
SITNLLYYDQILDKIGYPADACLMVGDEEKDLVAKRCGMETFLIEHKNKKFNLEIPEPTYKGSLLNLKSLL